VRRNQDVRLHEPARDSRKTRKGLRVLIRALKIIKWLFLHWSELLEVVDLFLNLYRTLNFNGALDVGGGSGFRSIFTIFDFLTVAEVLIVSYFSARIYIDPRR